MIDLIARPLYGGAIECCVPANFIDASEFRQVPDNQEVWVDRDATHGNDTSLIVELVEAIDVSPEQRAGNRAQAHFAALAQDNGAVTAEIALQDRQGCTVVDAAVDAELLVGVQAVPKYGKVTDMTKVRIGLACLHLAQFDTDVLITLNVPETAWTTSLDERQSLDILQRIVASFVLKDASLFG